MIQRDLGWPGVAITQFERSVLATPAAELRSQYLHRAYLLQAHVDLRTWDAAEQDIRHLLPLSTQLASTRTAVLLRTVLRRLSAGGKVPLSLQEQAAILSAALDEAPSRAGANATGLAGGSVGLLSVVSNRLNGPSRRSGERWTGLSA
jgi:hypothetical protein